MSILPIASIFTDIPEAIVVFFHDTVGLGWGPAIVALTFTVRLAILPLSLKQIRSMRAMQALQPQLKAIQEKYKDDKQRQQQEMMKFYQENEINPLASCFPLLLQLPVFFALYAMLKGDSFQQDVEESPPEGWLFIDSLIEQPEGRRRSIVLVVLFIVTQLAAGLAMSVRGQGSRARSASSSSACRSCSRPFVFTFRGRPLGLLDLDQHLDPRPAAVRAYADAGADEGPTAEEIEAAKPPPPPPRKKKKKSGRQR